MTIDAATFTEAGEGGDCAIAKDETVTIGGFCDGSGAEDAIAKIDADTVIEGVVVDVGAKLSDAEFDRVDVFEAVDEVVVVTLADAIGVGEGVDVGVIVGRGSGARARPRSSVPAAAVASSDVMQPDVQEAEIL